MIKNMLVGLGIVLSPVTVQAQQCHSNVGVANVAAPNYCQTATVGVAAVQQYVPQTYTVSVPVQVVSPQVVQAPVVAPQAYVTQNAYTQQVVGTALISQGYVQPTVTAQPPVVNYQPQVALPTVVQSYNYGLNTFQGTQNYVRTQNFAVGVNHGYGNVGVVNNNHHVGVSVNRNFGVGNRNVTVQKTVVQQGGLVGKIFGNRSVTKTISR